MPKIADYIKAIATKAGIHADNPELVKLAGNETLKDVELAPELTNLIDASLITVDNAKSHPKVKEAIEKVLKAELYNGVDAELSGAMDDLALSEAERTEILAERSSTKRAALLAKKVKEWEAAKNKSADGIDKKALTEQINAAKAEIIKLKADHDLALKAKDAEKAEALLQKDVESDLLGFKYSFSEATPVSVKLAAAKDSVNRRLAELGLKVVLSETGARKLVTKDGTDYIDTAKNQVVTWSDFISGALAQDNLLLVSQEGTSGAGNNYPGKIDTKNPGDPKVNQSLIDAADESLNDYMKAVGLNG